MHRKSIWQEINSKSQMDMLRSNTLVSRSPDSALKTALSKAWAMDRIFSNLERRGVSWYNGVWLLEMLGRETWLWGRFLSKMNQVRRADLCLMYTFQGCKFSTKSIFSIPLIVSRGYFYLATYRLGLVLFSALRPSHASKCRLHSTLVCISLLAKRV